MARIFLSYAREDRSCAERLVRVLKGGGHEVWWDRQIDGGEEFATEIEAALDKADAVLVAWSAHSVRSRWVRDEAAIGGDSGRLLPISIDGSQPPMGFRQFHTLDLKGWKGANGDKRTSELLRSIDRRQQGKGATPEKVAVGPLMQRTPKILGRALWAVAAAVGLLLLISAAYFIYYRTSPKSEAPRPTLALLPFTSTSSDPALKSLASQARDSTAHTLSDSGMPVRLIDTVAARGSDADYLLFGELSGTANKLIATVRLEDAQHRETVWSRKFELGRGEASLLPDRIGAQVAGTLGWSGALRMLDQGQDKDPTLTADLLRQSDLTGDPLQSYQISQRLSAKWPKSAMVQLNAAMYTGFALDEIPREQRPEAVASAQRAAERAKALAPEFGDVFIPACLLQPQTRFAQCEQALRAGMRADPDAPFVNAFLGELLEKVGRTTEGHELIRLTYAHDPYMPAKISVMIRMLAATGDDVEASKLYRRAIGWWPNSGLLKDLLRGLIERGDFKAVTKVKDELGPKGFPTEYEGIVEVARAVTSNSLVALKRNCANTYAPWVQNAECMLAFAKLGDMDSAYVLAGQLYPARMAQTQAEQQRIWLDQPDTLPLDFITSAAASALRRDQRYLNLARRVGLFDYWRSGKLPDFCRNRPETICAQLKRN